VNRAADAEKAKAPRERGALNEGNEEGYLKPNRMHKTRTPLLAFPALGHGVGNAVEPTLWTCWLKDVFSSSQQLLPR
jgi:hypothetical protein